MEIELPSGLILEAPDDADPKEVVQKYRANERARLLAKYQAEDKENYNPTKGMSGLEKFRAGLGSGMMQAARGVTNLVLPDSMTPEWASDETIKDRAGTDQALLETGAGLAGNIAGNVVATAPVGMGVGALARGAQGVGRGAQVLKATLGNPAGRAAVEGAATGAILADPDERLSGAVTGGVLSGALSKVAQGGGRLLKGLIKKSDAAEDLAQLAGQHGEDLFVPISQAADEGDVISRLGKTMYKEALPIIPGVGGKLKRQGAAAAEKMREVALREGTPTGTVLPKSAGNKVGEAVGIIDDAFKKEYDDTIKSYAFNIPSTLKNDIVSKIKAKAGTKTTVNSGTLTKVSDEVVDLMDSFADGKKVIDGTNLMNVKREISGLLRAAKGHEKGAYEAADNVIDDLIETELKQGGSKQNLLDLQRYKDLTPAWRAFKPVQDAAKGAVDKEGRFRFSALARAAKRSPEQRTLGQLGAATLDQPAATGTLTGKILANVGMAGAGVGAFMAPSAVAMMMGGGQVLASKPVQKLLMGDLKSQKALVAALRKNPRLMKEIGAAMRRGIVGQTVSGDENE